MIQNLLSEQNTYRTFDLALASTLSLWFPLEGIDKTNPHKSEFLFKRDNSLDRLVEAYWRRELKVEPQAFFAQLKFIKSRLYSQ